MRWSEDPINGLRILKGAEDEQARMEATWNAELQLKQAVQDARGACRAPAGAPKDRPLECVRADAGAGSARDHVLRRHHPPARYQEGKQPTPQGEVPYAVKFSDWREVEGVKLPHREEMTVGPMSMEATADRGQVRREDRPHPLQDAQTLRKP